MADYGLYINNVNIYEGLVPFCVSEQKNITLSNLGGNWWGHSLASTEKKLIHAIKITNLSSVNGYNWLTLTKSDGNHMLAAYGKGSAPKIHLRRYLFGVLTSSDIPEYGLSIYNSSGQLAWAIPYPPAIGTISADLANEQMISGHQMRDYYITLGQTGVLTHKHYDEPGDDGGKFSSWVTDYYYDCLTINNTSVTKKCSEPVQESSKDFRNRFGGGFSLTNTFANSVTPRIFLFR